MKTVRSRVSALALAIVLSLLVTAPAFAVRDDRESRGAREHVIRLIAKIRGVLGIGTNDDGVTIPKP